MGERLQLRPAADADDAAFAHDVTFVNMRGYVERHWGGWDRAVFFANYQGSENWIGWRSDERVGLVRLVVRPPVAVVEDLQVMVGERNKGFGRAMLADVAALARDRGCRRLRLRVFDDNPARRLYLRVGFIEVERDGRAAWMEQALA